ncbi:hypothetical protein T492DRAFT_313406 [Pavlovales sp. CCMP2436]|nr:hypothetical protein T492DRAFT_313406 [Pavlovales sp. CCMP2436]
MQQQSRYRIDFLLPVLRGLPLPSRSRTRKAGVSRLQPARSCHRVAGARADRTQSAQRHSRVEVPLRDFAQYPSASISTRLLPSVPVRCGKHLSASLIPVRCGKHLSASLSTRPLPSVPVRCGKHPGERRRAGGNLGLLAPTGLGEPLVELCVGMGGRVGVGVGVRRWGLGCGRWASGGCMRLGLGLGLKLVSVDPPAKWTQLKVPAGTAGPLFGVTSL